MSFNFGDGEEEKLRDMHRRLAEFIADSELALRNMQEWKEEMEAIFVEGRKEWREHKQEICEETESLKHFLTEHGVVRFSRAAMDVLAKGEAHVKTLEDMSTLHVKQMEAMNAEFQKIAKKSFDRLDRASTFTIKHISEAINSFRVEDFHQVAKECANRVEETCVRAIGKVNRVVRWFHWKNVSLVTVVSLFITLTMGLYLNDELPWEIHRQVVLQRNAGKALIDAWPNLTKNEKTHIINYAKRAFM